ncbi:hypothetical protein [Bacterioplanoides sp.]|uniref:hypothetical protein n=1 Tax=Bacterioplanoides sp. TaxID=2066072 RepID=UPI003AFFDD1E
MNSAVQRHSFEAHSPQTPAVETSSSEAPDEVQARQLLGTLSHNPDDIQAAYNHQYRRCALDLARVDTHAEQQQLEQRLSEYRRARAILLGELTPAAPQTTAPATSSPAATGPTESQPSGLQKPASHRALNVLVSSTLVLLLCALSVLTSLFINQKTQLGTLQHQLSEQSRYQQQLQQTLEQTLAHQEQAHQQWLAALGQQQGLIRQQQQQITAQQQQMAAQQQQIAQQQNVNLKLSQEMAQLGQHLSAEQRKGLALQQQGLVLQQQVARLNQQSDVLIGELCQDSAGVFPQVEPAMMPVYMNRCRLLWSLASE